MRQRDLVLSVLLAGVLIMPGVQAAGQKDDQAAARVVQASPVNLNTPATVSQLESLPGIGPRIAERIVAYRERTGGSRRSRSS